MEGDSNVLEQLGSLSSQFNCASSPLRHLPSSALHLRGGQSAPQVYKHVVAASEAEEQLTTPFEGQKPGTSGLRKRVAEVSRAHYLENFVQCVFDEVGEALRGATLVVSGDGRFHNAEAIQTICQMAAANGARRVWVGTDGLLSTPSASAVIREREGGKAVGGIVLTASHNPGGPDKDFGIKYNVQNGGPAPETFTSAVHARTCEISRYCICRGLPQVDLSKEGRHVFLKKGSDVPFFEVEIISPVEDYLALLLRLFDFAAMRALLAHPSMSFAFDAMHGVAGPYARAVFEEALGVDGGCLRNCEPKTDFGGGHPDPNLTYATELVKLMGLNADGSKTADAPSAPVLGAAADGDADRNMILGRGCFVTPSDSVAIIAAHAHVLPWLAHGGLKALARSMPTSGALDRVAQALGLPLFETPTGWKFFGNLMDATVPLSTASARATGGSHVICGEESFGTGSSHIREKDGLWAVLCWLSILAHHNRETPHSAPLVGVEQILRQHWRQFGRNFYSRYDYEEVDAGRAAAMMSRLSGMAKLFEVAGFGADKPLTLAPGYDLVLMDDFSYCDPVDGSVALGQGKRLLFADGSRVVFRLSGTGSVGATVRVYFEKYQPPSRADGGADADCDAQLTVSTSEALAPLVAIGLDLADLRANIGRDSPTVIT